ncbi:MAG: hypothetical protein AAGI01_01330 [Myxococcota bacterium]
MGYLAGHWPRITAWSFGQWMELFSRPGVDYTDRVGDYADLIEATALRLVTGALELDMNQWRRLRMRRVVRDLGYRALLALERLPQGGAAARAEDALWPALEGMAAQAELLRTQDVADPGVHALMEAFSEVAELFPDDVVGAWDAIGHRICPKQPHKPWPASSVSYVVEGSLGGAPATHEARGEEELKASVASLVEEEVFWSTGRLVARLAAHTNDEVTALEAWVAASPAKDEQAEWFGALPHELEELVRAPGELAVNTTLREHTWSAAAISAVFGEELAQELKGREEIGLAGFMWRGAFRLFAVREEERRVLDGAREAAAAPRTWLHDVDLRVVQTLLELGALCWFPSPLRS